MTVDAITQIVAIVRLITAKSARICPVESLLASR
jgi:hypothetical protein